jgi:hypothetical protein
VSKPCQIYFAARTVPYHYGWTCAASPTIFSLCPATGITQKRDLCSGGPVYYGTRSLDGTYRRVVKGCQKEMFSCKGPLLYERPERVYVGCGVVSRRRWEAFIWPFRAIEVSARKAVSASERSGSLFSLSAFDLKVYA